MVELQPDLPLTEAQAERVLTAWLGAPTVCSAMRRLEGGLVNTTYELEFNRPPHQAVIKLHRGDGDTFNAEARALQYLRLRTACPVPRVYLQESSGQTITSAFLLMERVPGECLHNVELDTAARADIESQLADVLGELHSHKATSWGGVDDANASSVTWSGVFFDRIIEARSHPAVDERLSPGVIAMVDRAIGLVPAALGEPGLPTLIHGDVWEGNLMVNFEDGRWRVRGLLDPKLQFADVECELAYLEVFDTPRETFFAGYTRNHELRPGYERRRLFYWLETALVHVALFGGEAFSDFTARTAERIGRL